MKSKTTMVSSLLIVHSCKGVLLHYKMFLKKCLFQKDAKLKTKLQNHVLDHHFQRWQRSYIMIIRKREPRKIKVSWMINLHIQSGSPTEQVYFTLNMLSFFLTAINCHLSICSNIFQEVPSCGLHTSWSRLYIIYSKSHPNLN